MGRAAQVRITVAIIVLVAIVIGFVVIHGRSPTATAASQTISVKHDQLTYQGVNGKTALALLESHARVTTQTSSYGIEVTGIDGVAQTSTKYWLFYVNGKEAQVGAGALVTKNGETITWKFGS